MAMQTKIATFTGVETTVPITWDTEYASAATFSGVNTTDGSTPSISLTGVTSAGLTVKTNATFHGTVEVSQIEKPV